MKIRTVIHLITAIGLVSCTTGCATGLVRKATLGPANYTTVDWTRKAPAVVKAPAAIAGVVADAAIVAADTVATPVVAVPLGFAAAFTGLDNSARDFRHHPLKETAVGLATFPFWLPITYPRACWELSYGQWLPLGGGQRLRPPTQNETDNYDRTWKEKAFERERRRLTPSTDGGQQKTKVPPEISTSPEPPATVGAEAAPTEQK